MKTFEEILVGDTEQYEYEITQEVVDGFIALFHDENQLHVDDSYAKSHGFQTKVAHGNIVNGFISHFVGMRFPGGCGILQSVNCKYTAPNYAGERILIAARVAQKVDAVRVVVLKLIITNTTRNVISARATVQVGFLQ